jgi:hypothetical protein
MKQYLYLAQSGDAWIVRQEPNEDSLTCLQTLVGGLIECVSPSKVPCDVWVNEESLFQPGFGINLVASYITGRQLVGPVVLASSRVDGATISVSQHLVNKLKREGLIIEETVLTAREIQDRYKDVYFPNETNPTAWRTGLPRS